MENAAAIAERATSDSLIGPDWAVNLELCDLVNIDPGQAKDALKTLKKKLGNKNPKIQLLALFVLETLSKNCGEHVFQQIVERDILHDMVKIVKKKPDLNVREKILTLINTWEEALGGQGGRFPQYFAAYNELKSAGVEFPPPEENSVPLFTPPQTHPIAEPISPYEEAAVRASLESESSGLSFPEIQNAEGLVGVLSEMLNALDPNNPQGLKDEIIVDLVDQCRSYQKRVMILVNNTADEDLLLKGLALNDNLQQVLNKHDAIANNGTPVAPLMNVNHEDEESEDDFAQLARRSKDTTPILPPPASKKPITSDYLSGDAYNEERPSPSATTPLPSHHSTNQNSSSDDLVNPTASMFAPKPTHDEPSYDNSLVGQTQNLSIKSPTPSKPEDTLFRDLVDFAKAKSSSPKPNQSY